MKAALDFSEITIARIRNWSQDNERIAVAERANEIIRCPIAVDGWSHVGTSARKNI